MTIISSIELRLRISNAVRLTEIVLICMNNEYVFLLQKKFIQRHLSKTKTNLRKQKIWVGISGKSIDNCFLISCISIYDGMQ